MLEIGDIRHTGITIRGAADEDAALKQAGPRIDAWQGELAAELPEGTRFRQTHHVRNDGNGHYSVYRYVTVVEDNG